ncbi:MAG: acyl-CoA dehydrogenase family protein [Proteobacteria bacterium]|nr:acyl-CoA dehydrogenase family protein [Pseudomonadota bacterium]MBU1450707.1 acyl-CoA dehydrogenase family protein [Pseudomonadota bacterium]MBU2468646.1 acyl-CoA dehydrogenase family protein [Pseudomonadota bacterium]
MDLGLTSEHQMIRETARRFARQELEPMVAQCESQECFPLEVFRKAGELGLLGPFFPSEYGGSDSDLLSNAIIIEELAKVSASFAMSVDVSAIYFGYNLFKLGSQEQKTKYLPDIVTGKKLGCFALTEPNAGSDTLSLATTAKRQGEHFIINGSKIFITNAPIADYFMVVTRTSPRDGIKGGTTFIVERGSEGMEVVEMHGKMGVKSSPTGEIYFHDLKVHQRQILGQQDQGFQGMMRSLNMERAMAPAMVIGMAQDCLDRSLAYVKTREQFGRPIAEYQLIQAKLAEMAMGIETSRAYLHKVIWMVENGMDVTKEAAILKCHSTRVATNAALEAIQIHGGYGYMQEYGVERALRDAKLMEIGGGTNEIQLLVIARELLRA